MPIRLRRSVLFDPADNRPHIAAPTKERVLTALGWAASATAVLMFGSYLDQIALNLDGQKGSVLLPLATMINCSLWTAYGALKPRKDWPLLVANLPGLVLGAITLITAL